MDLELRTWSVFYIPEELSDAMAKHSHYESEQLEVKWPQNSLQYCVSNADAHCPKNPYFVQKVNLVDLKLIEIGRKGT